MSNRIYIDVRNISTRTNAEQYQDIHIFDDFESESIYCEEIPNDPMELLKYCMQFGGETTQSLIAFMRESEKGVHIEDEWFDYDEIKHIIG